MIKATVGDYCNYKDSALEDARKSYCEKYIPFLESILNNAELQKSCSNCDINYRLIPAQPATEKTIHTLLRDAYDMGIIISNYSEVVEMLERDPNIYYPTKAYAELLSEDELLGVITYHFRADHFDNGCLIRHSIAKGYLLLLLKAFASK